MSNTLVLPPDVSSPRDLMLWRVLASAAVPVLSRAGEPGRAEAESFVTDKFRTAWQARVETFMPWLISLQCLGHCSAVAGIRPAASEKLFLEEYLDAPVEQVLGRVVGRSIPRRDIVEIGNLAASQRGSSHLLFLIFTATLHAAGYRWIVFTATQALRNNLEKLGFPLQLLAKADPALLDPTQQAEWGSYYASDPQVMVGSLDEAMRLASERPVPRRVLRHYREQVASLSLRLQEAACRT